MKQYSVSLVMALSLTCAYAQSPFNIVKPLDGSNVRETVRFLLPKNSVPPNSYVGIFVNDKFFEATTLNTNGKYYEYDLDTKQRNLPDGQTKFEFVLFTDFNDNPRITDRSSVVLNIGNHKNIKVPADGLKLRYHYPAGANWIYKVNQTVYIEGTRSTSARTSVLASHDEHLRMQYSVDESFGNGDGLLRMAALPPKGQHELFITTSRNPDGRKIDETDLASIYMRVTPTGNEVYGTIPVATPIFGNAGGLSTTNMYAAFPLPTLPSRSVKPGDAWQTRFQFGNIDLTNITAIKSLIEVVPARGELESIEWEMGRPCARIHQSIETTTLKGKKESAQETVWFALDRRQVIKIVREEVIDVANGVSSPTNTPPTPGGGNPNAARGGGGRAGGGDGGDGDGAIATPIYQQGTQGGPPPGSPGYEQYMAAQGQGQGRFQQPNSTARTPASNVSTGQRLRLVTTWVLEG